ncbi:MAG: chloride channel protein [Mailhella sp.]|nr:chloride channel protein [Mailhella sp.]
MPRIRSSRALTLWGNRVLLALEGIGIGLAAGFVICCFRLARDLSAPRIASFLSGWNTHWWIIPFWFAVLIAAARFLGFLVRKVPLISGSGIPQTELVASGSLHISRMEWLRILPAKFIGCLVSTLGGLSLGREGPCIQMGAATGTLLSGLWENYAFAGRIHVAAGAAAGMTAAFGSPIAGLLFVFEEMRTAVTWGGVIVTGFAVATAQLVAGRLFGFGLIFPFASMEPFAFREIWLLPVLGAVLGVAGVLYNRALLGTKNAEALHTPLPQEWRILPPMLAAAALAFLCPAVLGGGEPLVASLAQYAADPRSVLAVLAGLTLLKIGFALFSYTGNVPGGILMPMLCIGAMLGAVCGQVLLLAGVLPPEHWPVCIVFGMAGFFVSMVRVPLTGTALVLEMSGCFLCLPETLAVAYTAYFTANMLRCPPVYDSLRAAIAIPRRVPSGSRSAS